MQKQNLQLSKKGTQLVCKTVTTFSIGITVALSMLGNPAIAGSLVRKNVVDLTPQEKTDFVNAIKALKTTIPEGSTLSIYDQFTATHVGAMAMMSEDATGPGGMIDAAHTNAGFLPWHREYLDRFEKALQSVNPNVTIPYWDWTDPKAIDVIFQPDFLGSNGSGVVVNVPGRGDFEGGPVQSGNFSEADGWVLNPDLHFDPTTNQTLGTSLIRFLQLPPGDAYPIPQQEIDQLLAIDNYDLFRPALEGFISVGQNGQITGGAFLHNYIHGLVGGVQITGIDPVTGVPAIQPLGTFSSVPSSPNDPVFWIHHANVDRLWAEWQANGHAGSDFYPSTGQPYGHNLNDPMWPWDGGQSQPGTIGPGDIKSYLPILSPDDIVTPKDTLSIRDYGYTYDTIPEGSSTLGLLALGVLGGASLWQRQQLSRKNKALIAQPLTATRD
ncbi:tyrosinase family protein [Nostoc sp. CENA67]|uniref:Tyrosinase family protein n=1 Tax=Amazonocrinis nigriterrae CENA67 TaxID=2794033 RepID=A0A8J7L5S7_9NOST|nr:tyrosinase family protein [Amazonocrinis nigriterrae]MBH8561559.1 tyrosinase family protein [Amazonocrinis nigriterrae CENA67]